MTQSLLDLDELLASWMVLLRAQQKSPFTIRNYSQAVESYLDFCTANGLPRALGRSTVVAYLASQSEQESGTVRLRLTSVKLFARWLADEEDFDADRILSVRAPKLDQRAVPDLSDEDLRSMLKNCDGRTLRDRRDRAMLLMLAETGLRSAELLALDVLDANVADCVVHVRLGKGRKGRRVKFSPGTAAALDRYKRARRAAGQIADEGPLWISVRGNRLSYTGMVTTLKGRASAAGVVGFHVHRLRHTAAVRWLKSGGTETGLMAHAGWTSNTMVGRYVKSASEQLAAEEFDRLGLGFVES